MDFGSIFDLFGGNPPSAQLPDFSKGIDDAFAQNAMKARPNFGQRIGQAMMQANGQGGAQDRFGRVQDRLGGVAERSNNPNVQAIIQRILDSIGQRSNHLGNVSLF